MEQIKLVCNFQDENFKKPYLQLLKDYFVRKVLPFRVLMACMAVFAAVIYLVNRSPLKTLDFFILAVIAAGLIISLLIPTVRNLALKTQAKGLPGFSVVFTPENFYSFTQKNGRTTKPIPYGMCTNIETYRHGVILVFVGTDGKTTQTQTVLVPSACLTQEENQTLIAWMKHAC